MGNRSKMLGAAALVGTAAGLKTLRRRRRRARFEPVMHEIAEAIMPTVADDEPLPPREIDDEAHAASHEHLHWTAREQHEPEPRSKLVRPFRKHRHGMRLPGRM